VTYDFLAKVSTGLEAGVGAAEGLELTMFEADTMSALPVSGDNTFPMALSKHIFRAVVGDYTVNPPLARYASILIGSPNVDVLRNNNITRNWGSFRPYTSTDAANFRAGTSAVNSEKLFAYVIPAAEVGNIPAHLSVWQGADIYNNGNVIKSSAGRGTKPTALDGNFVANMLQVSVNSILPIPSASAITSPSDPRCTIRIHVPSSVVGIMFPPDLADLVWFEQNSDGTRYDIILERRPDLTNFTTFNMALITKGHIGAIPGSTFNIGTADPWRGDMQQWLGFFVCPVCNVLPCCAPHIRPHPTCTCA
jgi:hypothetical protein